MVNKSKGINTSPDESLSINDTEQTLTFTNSLAHMKALNPSKSSNEKIPLRALRLGVMLVGLPELYRIT